jgi:acyl-coenzyme A thioesterase PaaI-like protein
MSTWARLATKIGPTNILRTMNVYPPYLGAGIRVHPAKDGRSVTVSMRLTKLNQNYGGTHFGGSLYAMCDPFFVLLLVTRLGPGYFVTDKAAAIRFKKPGVGKVSATFEIADEEIRRIEREVADKRKIEPVYRVEVIDEAGETVAEIDKTLYVRKALRPRRAEGREPQRR